jgi:hypothetical protein
MFVDVDVHPYRIGFDGTCEAQRPASTEDWSRLLVWGWNVEQGHGAKHAR